MENKEIIKEYSITKKTAIMIMIQMILIIVAFVISIIGIVNSVGASHGINRLIIYSGQALTCFAIVLFGTYFFNKKDNKFFRSVIISYALLEALRVSLINTNGVGGIASFLAKFILVVLTLDAALLSDRVDKKEGLTLSLTMIGLEIILYLVFIIGFPAVRTKILYMILPFVGILMSGSMCLFVTGRLQQIKYSKSKKEKL